MEKHIILFIVFLISTTLFSQTEVLEEWTETFQNTSGIDIEMDEYNDVYVLTRNGTISKYDSNGNELWSTTFQDSTGERTAVDLTIDNSNNICYTGYRNGLPSEDVIITTKFDSEGNQLWEMYYHHPTWATSGEPIGIGTDDVGNVYVSGISRGFLSSSDYCRAVTIKYSSEVYEEWISAYHPIYDNWFEVSGIVVSNSGSVYITGGDGTVSWNVLDFYAFMTIKYSTDGTMEWDNFYSTTLNYWAFAEAITLDSDENIYVSGSFGDEDETGIATIKYNESGELLWESRSDISYNYNK
ncbi:MAG: hypothetical protein K8S23_01775 [Candidatus Cloacimonetes bacterium]|nr:hypothetical protein [Candidatus Cloacimonadota bacterium]